MKASEEIALDIFISDCIRKGVDNQYEIVQMAKQQRDLNEDIVKDFILNGKSISYEEYIDWETCIDCGENMMFDESQREYYCPFCDSL